jgi:WD40 repeat protein
MMHFWPWATRTLILSSLVLNCKRVPTATDLSSELDNTYECLPQLRSLLYRGWENDLGHIQLAGFSDEGTLGRAQAFLQTLGEAAPKLSGSPTIIAEGFDHFGRTPNTRRWLLIAADKRLVIRDQRLDRTFIIPNLVVNKMWMSSDSESVSMITANDWAERLHVRLDRLGISSYVGESLNTHQHFTEFMRRRDADILLTQKNSTIAYGFAYQHRYMSELFRQGKAKDATDRYMAEVFSTSWYNDPRTNGVSSINGTDFPWPAANIGGYFVIAGPKGFVNSQNQEIDRAAYFGPRDNITAFGFHRSPRIANTARHWLTAHRRCNAGLDNRQACRLDIHSHYEGLEQARHPLVFSMPITDQQSQSAITALAEGPLVGKRQLIAFALSAGLVGRDRGATVHILEVQQGQPAKTLRTLRFASDVTQLRFAEDDLDQPRADYLGGLYVETLDANKQFKRLTVQLDAALKPIVVGQHQAGNGTQADWRFASVQPLQNAFAGSDQQSRSTRWQQLPTTDQAAVYGLTFDKQAPCETLVSAGSDGRLLQWDMRTVGAQSAQSRELPGSIPGQRIVSLDTHARMNQLLAAFSNGTARLWNLRQLGEPISPVIPTQAAATVEAASTPVPPATPPDSPAPAVPGNLAPQSSGKPSAIIAAGLLSSGDGVVLLRERQAPAFYGLDGTPRDQQLDEVSAARLLSQSAEDSTQLVALTPLSDFLRLPDMHVFASSRGFVASSNIRQRSGGEYHLLLVDDRAPPFLPMSLATNQDGTWVFAAGMPAVGTATGTLLRFPSQARGIGAQDRFEHCPGAPISSGSQLKQVPYIGHVGPVMGLAVQKLKGTEKVVSVGLDGRMIVWSLLDPCIFEQDSAIDRKIEAVYEVEQGLTSVAVSRDGRYVAAGTLDGKVLLWWIDDSLEIDP